MWNWIFKLNILQRLLLYFIIVIIISVSIVSSLIYLQASREIKKQQSDYLEYIIENASYQTNLFIEELEYTTIPLISNDRVKSFLEIDRDDRLEYYYHHSDIQKMMDDLLIQNEAINLVFLIGENERAILSEGRLTEYDENTSFENMYDNLLKTTPETGAANITLKKSLQNEEYVLTMTRNVRGRTHFIPKGVFGIEIQATSLEKLWDISNLKNGTSLWIFDENNQIVYHPDEHWVGEKIDENLNQNFKDNKDTFIDKWRNEEMIFSYIHSPETTWTLVAMTPQQNVYEPLAGLNKKVVIAIGISLFIALLLSIAFANTIIKPLRKVQKGMKQTETGDWVKLKPLKGKDEISSVVSSYNLMIDRLSILIKNLTKAELKNHRVLFEKQSIEFQALQSQINPHFLYNTLETMNAYAIIKDEVEISEMTVALAQMFRYAVRNLEVVTLMEEKEHVENFLTIAKHRIQREIDVQFLVDQNLYNEEVVKLTIQPIVENAILHGFKKNSDIDSIAIQVTKSKGLLLIEIKDNGVGIPPEKLEELKRVLKQTNNNQINTKMGIGLSNVNRRIQLIYGNDYGLDVYSQMDVGTTVGIKMPRL